jgi:hypothetical protein
MKRTVVIGILGVSVFLTLSLVVLGCGHVKTGPLVKDLFPGASVSQIGDEWCICTCDDPPAGTAELSASMKDGEPHLDAYDSDGNLLGEVPITCDCVPAPVTNARYAF